MINHVTEGQEPYSRAQQCQIGSAKSEPQTLNWTVTQSLNHWPTTIPNCWGLEIVPLLPCAEPSRTLYYNMEDDYCHKQIQSIMQTQSNKQA